jgi:hypothetical protein
MIEVSFGGKQAIRRWRKAPLELRRDVIGAPASKSGQDADEPRSSSLRDRSRWLTAIAA